jgi:nucleoside triphosphate pyrophosphatase
MMSFWRDDQPLVLASRSVSRRTMLEAAGIPLEIFVPNLDERAVEAGAGSCSPAEVATLLAREKAKAAARLMPHRIIVAADQTLALNGRRFDKPRDRNAAHEQLMMLAGKTHQLYSAVVLARDGQVLFDGIDTANLTLRKLSGLFLDRYLDAAGDAVLACVGAYQLEKLGIHLFDRIDGDHFTILGLPLLKLLDFLRRIGSLAA